MLRRVASYKEFCDLAEKERIVLQMRSEEGKKAIKTLRNAGWDISFVKPEKNILDMCMKSIQNFEYAYRDADLDFWAKS